MIRLLIGIVTVCLDDMFTIPPNPLEVIYCVRAFMGVDFYLQVVECRITINTAVSVQWVSWYYELIVR